MGQALKREGVRARPSRPAIAERMVVALIGLLPIAVPAQMSRDGMETGTLMPNASAGGYATRSGDVRSVMAQFAGCTFRRCPARVEKMLQMPVDGADYRHMLDALLDSECLGTGTLQFSNILVRGALFEQLYLREFGRQGPDDLSKAPVINYRLGYAASVSGEAATIIGLAQFGDCVVRADATDVKQLLLSAPDTAAEAGAFAATTPYLRKCIPRDRTVSFSRSMLRIAFDEAMFRLAHAQAGRPWGLLAAG